METLLCEQGLSELSSLNPNVRKGSLARSDKRRAELARIVTALFEEVMRTVAAAEEDQNTMFQEVAKSFKGKALFGLDSSAKDSDRYECIRVK